MVVRKTDDELTRYVKQVKRTENRKKFEKNMQDEDKRRELGLNTHEIRVEHYMKMADLEKHAYNKAHMNDSEMTYDYLHDKANYKPLPERLWSAYLPSRIFNSRFNVFPFLAKPFYAK